MGKISQLLRGQRSNAMLDRGPCWIITAVVEGDRYLLMSVYAPTRKAAIRAVRRGKVTECIDGYLVTHEGPTILGEPIEQLEWLGRVRNPVWATDEEVLAPLLIDA